MALSDADRALLADMRQRELHLKRRERAAEAILHESRRYRLLLSAAVALAFALLVAAVVGVVSALLSGPPRWWLGVPITALGMFVGVFLGQQVWETERGRRLLARKESRLRRRYSGDLHSGRRWLPFYYRGEDISAYVPQILYSIESEGRFDSVDAALDLAKRSRRESAFFAERALEVFARVEGETNGVVISSTDDAGRPSSRIMRFVRTDRPGVWFVTTAPEGPKVPEFDRGLVALVTSPTVSGATISSNQVEVRRAGVPFSAVADLYDAQVPGYADGMTEEEQQRELVFELRLLSARVDTWVDNDVVHLGGGDAAKHAESTTNLD